MRNLFLTATLVVCSLFAYSQENDCDDPSKQACCQAGNSAVVAITPLADLQCKDRSAHLYKIFPKIPIYKGFLFNQVNMCGAGKSSGILEFEYCIAKTRQHMTVTITDWADPFFKTDAGQSQVNFFQTMFLAGTSPILKTYPSKNQEFNKSFIAMQGNETKKYVSFEGLKDNRFLVHIVIDGDRFKLATEVDTFLADYINTFDF